MFVKYNGVLRGLRSESPFLHNTMVQLCCPRATFDAYIGNVPPDKMYLNANGTTSFEQAKASINKYTTTLHGINSAVIKLGCAPRPLTTANALSVSACLHRRNASSAVVCFGAES